MSPDQRRGLRRTAIAALGIGILSLAALLVFAVQPTYGRWEIPETVPRTGMPKKSSDVPVKPMATPSPTDVPLPDEADVPILMYHYVSLLPAGADVYRRDLTVSPESLEQQLQYLQRQGYHPVTLTDLYLYLTEGYSLPENPVVLTFDDGYRDAYEVVFPKLLDHGFPGTFFVLATPAHHERVAYLTWSQMKEMSDAGMDIQAHSRDHVDLRDRPYDYLVYQILGIKEAIQHHTDRVPRFFAYPSGRWDSDVVAVLESAGYWGAVTTEWGRTHTRENVFEMARLRVRGGESLESFISKLEEE
ncbi:MAG: polysaccharide deacetylase family protein [Anaerolineae bacterium]